MLRYTSQLKTWAARRAEIFDHFESTGSLSETARAFQLTRERIRQIVNKEKGRRGFGPVRGNVTS